MGIHGVLDSRGGGGPVGVRRRGVGAVHVHVKHCGEGTSGSRRKEHDSGELLRQGSGNFEVLHKLFVLFVPLTVQFRWLAYLPAQGQGEIWPAKRQIIFGKMQGGVGAVSLKPSRTRINGYGKTPAGVNVAEAASADGWPPGLMRLSGLEIAASIGRVMQ